MSLQSALRALIGLGMIAVILISAQADVSVTPAPEPLSLEWLKALGFPTWAVVLLYVGHTVVRTLTHFFEVLQDHVTQTERRLARLEGVVLLKKKVTDLDSDDGL